MVELISFAEQGKISHRCHLYHIGIHNMGDKENYTDDEIEQIAQKIKEKFIEGLSKTGV